MGRPRKNKPEIAGNASGAAQGKRLMPLSIEVLKQLPESMQNIDHMDKMSLYIHFYNTPDENGKHRTKREAALLAGYSQNVADNAAYGIEANGNFNRKLKDYIDAWPDLDIRADCIHSTASIVRNGAKDKDRIAAATYLTNILGEFAPKQIEKKSLSIRASLPQRSTP